jgi:hypothetical protein
LESQETVEFTANREAFSMVFDIFGVPQAVRVIILVVGIIHVIRTQRSWWWILLMVWLPVIGFVIYFFMEWLPEIRRGKPGMPRKESNRKQINRLLEEVQLVDTVERRAQLAEALLAEGEPEEAARQLEQCDSGPYRDDVFILMSLAEAYLECESRSDEAMKTVDRILALESREKPRVQALLKARALEAVGRLDEAKEAYGNLGEAEARCRYGLLLRRMGDLQGAKETFDLLLLQTKRASKVWKKQEAKWIAMAKRERKELG